MDAPLPRRTGFADSRGERIYWESVGSGDPLVLCHGMGGNHGVWFQQVPVLAQQRRVVVWDHAGFGRSSDTARASGPDAAVQDLAAVLAAADVDGCDLIGQSMGGWTALGFALAWPGRVRHLVLTDTLGGLWSAEIEAELRTLGAGLGEAPAELGRHPALDDSLGRRDPARAYLYQLLGGFGEPDLPGVIPRLLGSRVDTERAGELAMPVLFVVGERDPLFPPSAVRLAAARVPVAQVVEIPGCGHSPYFEDPAPFNAAVVAFLDAAN